MVSIPRERENIMAVQTAKASAVRGNRTNYEVDECWEEETRSSMIEPNPANPVEEFPAASVYTEHSPDRLRFGSILINVSEEKYLEGLEPTSIL